MEEKKTEAIRQLKTLEEFQTKIPKNIHELWMHNRWGELIGRFEKPVAIKKFHNHLVFNYWVKDEETWYLYISA